MSTPSPIPTAIPWYQSHVLRGLLTILVSQAISRVASGYHIDIGLFGLTIADIVSWLMDAISAGALAFAAHARVAKPQPQVTLTKAGADKVTAPLPQAPTEKS